MDNNQKGDLISREALKENFEKAEEQADTYEMLVEFHKQIIDNAQTVPLPNEQIAWEQGYEAGLAQGKHDRPKGEWIHYLGCGIGKAVCSECGQVGETKKYCGNCGVRMKGDKE